MISRYSFQKGASPPHDPEQKIPPPAPPGAPRTLSPSLRAPAPRAARAAPAASAPTARCGSPTQMCPPPCLWNALLASSRFGPPNNRLRSRDYSPSCRLRRDAEHLSGLVTPEKKKCDALHNKNANFTRKNAMHKDLHNPTRFHSQISPGAKANPYFGKTVSFFFFDFRHSISRLFGE